MIALNSDSSQANGLGKSYATLAQSVVVASQFATSNGFCEKEREFAISTSLATKEKSNHTHIGPGQELENKREMARRAAKQHKKWNKRLKILFCCLGYKKNKDSIADVASIFAEFYADLKVPSSDIAAGFVLLSKYQAAQRQWIVQNSQEKQLGVEQYLNGIPIKVDTKFLDLSTADDSHLVNDLIYYLNYSLAIFGWPMHLVDDPCLLCCIYPYLKLSPCCGSKSGHSDSSRQQKLDNSNNNKEKKNKKKTKTKISSKKADKANEQSEQKQKGATTSGAQQVTANSAGSDCEECEQLTSSQQEVEKDETDGGKHKRQGPVVGKLDGDCDIPIILEDNCCSCNVASAERRLASHNYEIIYVSYKVNINVVPFLVAADHSKRTIVVAIRGSMSLSDMVTDMNGQIDKVPLKDCPDDWLCHRGITRAALYVKHKLEQERIIERALNCRPDLGSHSYTLVLCGHSLGAGAAAILGVLMRPHYPNLKAYLYSPPGGILSMPVVEYTKEFAIGVILGNDTVPRLGVAQLERLRYHTLLSIKSAHKSTGKILAKALCPTCCFGDNRVEYDPSQSLDLLHGTEGRSFEYGGSIIPFQSQPQVLYVPGRLVHVVKNYSFKSKKTSKTTRLWSGPIYQAVWTDNSIYDRVIISEGMFFDHLPNKLMQAMKMLFCKTLPARNDSNESSTSVFNADGIDLKLTESKLEAHSNSLAYAVERDERKSMMDEKIVDDCVNHDKSATKTNDDAENDDNNIISNTQSCEAKVFPNLKDDDVGGTINRELRTSEKSGPKMKQQQEKTSSTDNHDSIPETALATMNKLNLDENGNEQF